MQEKIDTRIFEYIKNRATTVGNSLFPLTNHKIKKHRDKPRMNILGSLIWLNKFLFSSFLATKTIKMKINIFSIFISSDPPRTM